MRPRSAFSAVPRWRAKTLLAPLLAAALAITVLQPMEAVAAPPAPGGGSAHASTRAPYEAPPEEPVPSEVADVQQAAREDAPPVDVEPDLSDPLPDDELGEALEQAAATGKPVEIASQTTETTISYAQPDGRTVSVESAAAPVRTQVDGEWVEVDTTLKLVDGEVRPVAVSGETVFSAGGNAPMVVLGDGEGQEVAFDWPGELPAPELEGNVATYRDVLPDVDLVLTATRLGFEQHVVVNSPPDAATLEALATLELPVTTEGSTLTETETGQLQVVDEAGAVVVTAAAPVMWDARSDGRTGEPAAVAELDVELTAPTEPGTDATLVVTPATGYLTDPATEYPVVIDPTHSLALLGDSYVANDFPNNNYGGSAELRTGTYQTNGPVHFSYLNFDTGPMTNKVIQSATLSLYLTHSFSCTPSWVDIKFAAPFDANTVTWNNRPSIYDAILANANVAACPANWVNFNLQGAVQHWVNTANGNNPVMALAITPGSYTDPQFWKKFASGNSANVPSIAVTYDGWCDQYNGNKICGAIRDKWWATGGPSGPLGLPITGDALTPNGQGFYNDFQGGSIYYSNATGAHFVRGEIRNKWTQYGRESGWLGFPTLDETCGLVGGGCYAQFQVGSIYWTAATGAHSINGAIRNKWVALGSENSFLGYPKTDEVKVGVGAYNDFTGGSIYWSPSSGAHFVVGGVRALWGALGYEGSFLGFPTSDEYDVPSGRRSDFAGGQITWDSRTGLTDWGAGPTSAAGNSPWGTRLDYGLSDRVSASVDVGTGNLNLSVAGLTVPGVGGDHQVGLTYNSLAGALGSVDGQDWRLTDSIGTRLVPYPDGSVRYIDPSGRAYVYEWDASSSTYTPQTGDKSTSLTRNTAGDWVLTTLASNDRLTFRAADGLLIGHADRNGNAFSYVYDASGLPTSITGSRAGGAPVTFAFGGTGVPTGKLASMSQTVGGTTRKITFGYNSSDNRLSSVTDPLGQVTSFTWNGLDITAVTSPSGVATNFVYDTGHRVVRVVRDAVAGGFNATDELTYTTATVNGLVLATTKVKDARGNTTTYTVDAFGKVTGTVDPLGRTRSASYNPNNGVTQLIGATPANVTTMAYNAAAAYQRTVTTAPTGATSTLEYPNSGTGPTRYLPSKSTDPQGNVTTYVYDSRGNLISSTRAGVTTSQTYNPAAGTAPLCGGLPGQLCTATDGLGRVTTFTYDAGGNLLTATPPAGGAIQASSITYDSQQRVATTTDGNGVVTSYGYDALNRPVEVRVGGSSCSGSALCTTVHYDSNGNVVSREDPAGTTTYTYDSLNRLVSNHFQGSGQNTTSTMTYDLVGNLVSFTDVNGTVNYGYNAAQELVSLAEPGGSCTGTKVSCTTFSYDANGVRTQVLYPGGTKIEYLDVDASSRPLHYRATNSAGTTLMDFTYSFRTGSSTDTGLIQRRTDAVAGGAVQQYTYDGLNQLTRAVESAGGATTASWAYCYDAAGNRTFDSTSTASTVLCPGQSGGPAPTYTHDATNALTGVAGQPAGAFTYDGNGAELSGVGVTARTGAQWNSLGQLTGLSTDGTAHSYSYAGMGNGERLAADGATFDNTALGTTTQSGDNAHSVIREPNGNPIALRSGGESYYFVTDRQGSTIALVDDGGTLQNSYSYDPYGKSRSKTETVFNPWQYIGGYLDAGGLYHLGVRYYDPVLGRFTQPDPSGQNPHYTYAGNNPINASDPSGLAYQADTYGSGTHDYGANIGVYAGGSGSGGGGAMVASRPAGTSSARSTGGWAGSDRAISANAVWWDWLEDAGKWVRDHAKTLWNHTPQGLKRILGGLAAIGGTTLGSRVAQCLFFGGYELFRGETWGTGLSDAGVACVQAAL